MLCFYDSIQVQEYTTSSNNISCNRRFYDCILFVRMQNPLTSQSAHSGFFIALYYCVFILINLFL